jgi:hypothetical protein
MRLCPKRHFDKTELSLELAVACRYPTGEQACRLTPRDPEFSVVKTYLSPVAAGATRDNRTLYPVDATGGAPYGAGLRVSEVAALKVDDIDSSRMLIRVEQGKGRKDRNAMLSPHLLTWWKEGKRRGVMLPHGWLFPGRSHGDPISTRQINRAIHQAATRIRQVLLAASWFRSTPAHRTAMGGLSDHRLHETLFGRQFAILRSRASRDLCKKVEYRYRTAAGRFAFGKVPRHQSGRDDSVPYSRKRHAVAGIGCDHGISRG